MALTLAVRDGDAADVDTPLLGVLLQAGTDLPGELETLDERLGGALTRTLARGDFRGARDESLHLDGGSSKAGRVLLVGLGAPTEPAAAALRRGAALLARQGHRMGAGALAIVAPGADAGSVEAVAIGLNMGAWEYVDLKTPPPEAERKKPLTRATILADGGRDAKDALAPAVGDAAIGETARRIIPAGHIGEA